MKFLQDVEAHYPNNYLEILKIMLQVLDTEPCDFHNSSVQKDVGLILKTKGLIEPIDHANVLIDNNLNTFKSRFIHECKERWEIPVPAIDIKINGTYSTLKIDNKPVTSIESFDSIMVPLVENGDNYKNWKYDAPMDEITSYLPDQYYAWTALLKAYDIDVLSLDSDNFESEFMTNKEFRDIDTMNPELTANILISDTLTRVKHLLNFKSITDWQNTSASELSIISHTNGKSSELSINNSLITDAIDFITQAKLPLEPMIEDQLFKLSNNQLMKKVF
jgi:hypothetical protein